jgi:cation diffusion facilitator family transporter
MPMAAAANPIDAPPLLVSNTSPMWPRLRHVPHPEALAALASVGISVVLLAIKFIAYFLTGSAAIFSDALESIVNVTASSFALYSLLLAHQPADPEHPDGHGKDEFLSAGFEGGMILLAALVIIAEAILDMVRPGGPKVEKIQAGLYLTLAAGAVNGIMGLGLILIARGRNSITLAADGKHLLSDAITSFAVLAGLFIVKLSGWAYADPITAIVVAFYIGGVSFHLLRTSAAGLMDEQDQADARLLRRILDSHLGPDGKEPRVCAYHKLRHRHSGRYHWIDFHIMVPASWNIDRAHKVASAIEYEIELALSPADATAHVEPCADAACQARHADGTKPAAPGAA